MMDSHGFHQPFHTGHQSVQGRGRERQWKGRTLSWSSYAGLHMHMASSNMPGFSCSYNLYAWVTNFLQYIAGNYCHANLRGRKSLRRYDVVMMLSLVVCTVCLWHLPFTIDKIEPNRAMCNQPSWLQQCSVSDCSCLKISIMGWALFVICFNLIIVPSLEVVVGSEAAGMRWKDVPDRRIKVPQQPSLLKVDP